MRMCGEHKNMSGKLVPINTVVKLNSRVKKLNSPYLMPGDIGTIVDYCFPHYVVRVGGKDISLTKSYFLKVVK